jgi:hypothetical protein
MEINILFSRDNADHLRTADYVRQAVRNLGISATIVERDTWRSHNPQVVVNGFNLIGEDNRKSSPISYEIIRNALEQTAWVHI